MGGRDKSFEQIADLPHSYILADGIEHPIGKKLPLWIVGLLYWATSGSLFNVYLKLLLSAKSFQALTDSNLLLHHTQPVKPIRM